MGQCCVNCLQDGYLKQLVLQSDTSGDCDYCGSRDVPVAPTSSIGRLVRQGLLKVYEISDPLPKDLSRKGFQPEGVPVELVLTEEHALSASLPHEVWSRLAVDLLTDAMSSQDDAIIDLGTFMVDRDWESESQSWIKFTHDVKYYSRFHQVVESTSNRAFEGKLGTMLESFGRTLPCGTYVYRARIVRRDDSYRRTPEFLGPPPPDRARSSRMSPVGISYLYVSDTAETCVAEVRPPVGSMVVVGEFCTNKELRILDLTILPSIFDPSVTRYSKDFLDDFVYSISKPVLPDDSDLEYLPTQALSEFVRDHGYQGIKYRGSQEFGIGINYAFFCGSPDQLDTDCPHPFRVLPSFADWFQLTHVDEYWILSTTYGLSGGVSVDTGSPLLPGSPMPPRRGRRQTSKPDE